jgi:hypothetical protein
MTLHTNLLAILATEKTNAECSCPSNNSESIMSVQKQVIADIGEGALSDSLEEMADESGELMCYMQSLDGAQSDYDNASEDEEEDACSYRDNYQTEVDNSQSRLQGHISDIEEAMGALGMSV